jgi:acyl-CoA synthetase (NDP forming)
MVGFGGIYAEMFQDVSFRLAPIDVSEAGRMLSELTGYALLNGARGLPPCDISAINKMVARVSEVIACEPEIMELDLNPVMVSAANAIVADARVIVQNQGASAPPTALSVRG